VHANEYKCGIQFDPSSVQLDFAELAEVLQLYGSFKENLIPCTNVPLPLDMSEITLCKARTSQHEIELEPVTTCPPKDRVEQDIQHQGRPNYARVVRHIYKTMHETCDDNSN